MDIYPDDVPLFVEIATQMRTVAHQYGLHLRKVSHTVKPSLKTSALGTCDASGHIHLTLRTKDSKGNWMAEMMSVDRVWEVAAHEMAHLRHMNHGDQFREFEAEMLTALTNRREEKADPKNKIMDRLIKLQAQRDGEAEIGNLEASEAFAGMINKMLIEHELNPSDIDYARAADRDPVIEIRCDLAKYGVDKKKSRIAWQEQLARIVSHANLCKFLVAPRIQSDLVRRHEVPRFGCRVCLRDAGADGCNDVPQGILRLLVDAQADRGIDQEGCWFQGVLARRFRLEDP